MTGAGGRGMQEVSETVLRFKVQGTYEAARSLLTLSDDAGVLPRVSHYLHLHTLGQG